MNQKPQIRVDLFSPQGRLLCSIPNPRKFIIKSGFGAMKRRCWLELYNEHRLLPVSIGSQVEIRINGMRCFNGFVAERRIDSIDDQLTLYAVFDPERVYTIPVGIRFENRTVPEMVQALLADTGLTLKQQHPHAVRFSALEFSNTPLVAVIDLLAKLAGNWLWDIGDNGQLRFRPANHLQDHQVRLKPDAYTINIRETANGTYSYIEVYCGIDQETEYQQIITDLEASNVVEEQFTRIYTRAIISFDVFSALARAVKQQMSRFHYEHYIDLEGVGEHIQPGDTVKFQLDETSLFPSDQTYRVKLREIEYSHETYKTRLYVTTGFESAADYFHYQRRDQTVVPLFLRGRTGLFQLDVSAIDSGAKLDID